MVFLKTLVVFNYLLLLLSVAYLACFHGWWSYPHQPGNTKVDISWLAVILRYMLLYHYTEWQKKRAIVC